VIKMCENNSSKTKANSNLDNNLVKTYTQKQAQNKNNIDKKYIADSSSKKNKPSLMPLTKYVSY